MGAEATVFAQSETRYVVTIGMNRYLAVLIDGVAYEVENFNTRRPIFNKKFRAKIRALIEAASAAGE